MVIFLTKILKIRLDGYIRNQVEQITSTTFPEFQPSNMGGIGGLPFARKKQLDYLWIM